MRWTRQTRRIILAGLLSALAGCAQQREINALRRDSLNQTLMIEQCRAELADREHTLSQFELATRAAEAIIHDLQREIQGLDDDRKEAAKKLAAAEERLEQALRQLAVYERQLADARADLEQLRNTLIGLQPPQQSDSRPDGVDSSSSEVHAGHE